MIYYEVLLLQQRFFTIMLCWSSESSTGGIKAEGEKKEIDLGKPYEINFPT